ncbi:MAG: hypothetical protein QGF59_25915 [Pirellulaceae bacterium]|nr:hypothetical protein [Planctomycetaceae bacterium]MDP6722127.1 hypothetical protein [Pirellulaceae bacterium]
MNGSNSESEKAWSTRIVSDNGDRWESAALIAEDGIDLRDPKLSIMPDGWLMLIMGGSVYDDKGTEDENIVHRDFDAEPSGNSPDC